MQKLEHQGLLPTRGILVGPSSSAGCLGNEEPKQRPKRFEGISFELWRSQ